MQRITTSFTLTELYDILGEAAYKRLRTEGRIAAGLHFIVTVHLTEQQAVVQFQVQSHPNEPMPQGKVQIVCIEPDGTVTELDPFAPELPPEPAPETKRSEGGK